MASIPKKFDLSGLTLDSLIVHEVFKGTSRLDPSLVPERSTKEAPPDGTTLDFLARQLKNGIIENGYPAIPLEDADASTASKALLEPLQRVEEWSGDDAEQVFNVSRDLAMTLQACQEHNSPPGMFAVSRGMLKGRRVVVIMKLESQRGLRLVRGGESDNRIMTLEVNPDLFVGNKAKLFKGAIFWATTEGLRTMICDEQMENRPAHPAAQYFVRDLLGCTIDDDLTVRTARFFEAAAKASESVLEASEDRSQVLSAIRAEMGSNRRTIDPVDFIDANFPAEKKAAVEAVFRRSGVELSKFAKDTSGLDRRFKRTTFRFEDGPAVIAAQDAVKVVGPGDDFSLDRDGVQVRYDGAVATMVIRGVVQGMTPRS